MAIATATLTVNAAFLQEIKEDNQRLRELLDQTQAALADESAVSSHDKRIVLLFRELREQLALHFTLEEAYGYFEGPVSVAPHLDGRAEKLLAQHQGLFVEVCELTTQAEQMLDDAPEARAVACFVECHAAFQKKLRRHEDDENDLIQQAFLEDIGVCD